MRLGLESLSPRLTSHVLPRRRTSRASCHSSASSPIAVDDDSPEDAELQFPYVQDSLPFVNRPSLLNLDSTRSSDEVENTGKIPSEHEQVQLAPSNGKYSNRKYESKPKDLTASQTNHTVNLKPFQNPIHGFMDTKPPFPLQPRFRDNSRTSCTYTSSNNNHSSSLYHDTVQNTMLCAARTIICGKAFDRCELEFARDHVQLTIWKDHQKPQWQGDIKYAHIMRFCFSRVDRPPYILLLQLDNTKGKSDFAAFYDPIFAQMSEETDTKEQTRSKVYGVVMYFDEAMDYMRCQSIAASYPMLAELFQEKLSESEVRQHMRLDVLRMSRHPRRSGTTDSSCCGSRNHSFAELMGNGTKHAFSSVTSFFRPTARSSVLEEDEGPFVISDHENTNKSQTLSLSGNSNQISSLGFGEEKSPILIDDVVTEKQEYGSGAVERDNTVAVMCTPREQCGTETAIDGSTSSVVQENEKQSENANMKIKALPTWLANERLKRKKIESRRSEELLEYPYDGSDKLGRISVTLGDIDRLVPGEFLNDNIINFYLRYLWRHLDSLQQQHMYFFTTHFFSQLNGTNGAYELSSVNPDERYTRVARWTHKETNLFDKRFLFIPINDSFHWSLAVFCNPGSAVIKKHRKVRCRRRVITDSHSVYSRKIVDLVHGRGVVGGEGSLNELILDGSSVDEEIYEEELKPCQEDRLAHPPCILFLDSLRCHRKKKFAMMLRNYLECEYKARYGSSSANSVSKPEDANCATETDEQDTVVTVFDSDSIGLFEPSIPLQSNSSDCGVFLLMYAQSIVRLYPFGVTREDLESNLTSTLTPNMFHDEHVLEFREYLQQLLFCLQSLAKHGLPEQKVKEEGLDCFAVD